MSKKSKSKRFFQQSADSIQRHSERIPYYTTLAEAEERQRMRENQANSSYGGF